MTATTLLETALNGMGLGTKISDIEQMYTDHKQQGDELAAMLLLDLCMALEDLARAERMQTGAINDTARYLANFQANPTISNAEWLSLGAKKAEQHAREAHAEYTRVGNIWRIWVAASKNF